MLKEWIRSAIHPFGIDIVKYPPRWRSPLGLRLREFFREQRINLVVDVGACDGVFSSTVLRSEAEYSGPIIGIEPCLRTFNDAKQRMSADINWRGLQVGLSDADVEGSLHTFEDKFWLNSLLPLREENAAPFKVNVNKRGLEKITLRRFDTLWDDITLGIESPRIFLKMDTQGHDTNVFRGAKEHLPFIIGAQSEIAAIELYDGMTSMSHTLKFFIDLGYTPIGFYEVNNPDPNIYNGAVPEFDVVFKRRD